MVASVLVVCWHFCCVAVNLHSTSLVMFIRLPFYKILMLLLIFCGLSPSLIGFNQKVVQKKQL